MSLNNKGLINYLLLPLSVVFYVLSNARKWFYKIGLLTTYKFEKPVIIVGNITVGGTGKTPVVIALVKHFQKLGKKVGVVSRGYGAQSASKISKLVNEKSTPDECGDEPLLIFKQTKAKVMVNKNRVCAVNDLIKNHQIDLIISDDGLQHYAMDRDVEICMVNDFGNGFFLPAGPMREPQKRLNNIDFKIKSNLMLVEFINIKTGEKKPLDYFKNQTCHAIAGIGNPQKFFDTLERLNIKIIQHPFKDHHNYSKQDIEFLKNYPVIMTSKDWVKCEKFADDKTWYLDVKAKLEDDFLIKLEAKL